jgi:hypothetical protein
MYDHFSQFGPRGAVVTSRMHTCCQNYISNAPCACMTVKSVDGRYFGTCILSLTLSNTPLFFVWESTAVAIATRHVVYMGFNLVKFHLTYKMLNLTL